MFSQLPIFVGEKEKTKLLIERGANVNLGLHVAAQNVKGDFHTKVHFFLSLSVYQKINKPTI